MAGNVPFLMKDVALLAVSIYLLNRMSCACLRAAPARTSHSLEPR